MSLKYWMVLLCACLGSGAWAQTYKCRQADGQTSFQDHPCSGGAAGGQMHINVTPPSADPSSPQYNRESAAVRDLAAKQFDAQQHATNQAQEREQQVEAYNRAVRCNQARNNLGALKSDRPVFRYDNKGDRQYLEDSARKSEMNAAQRAVAQNCN